MNLNHGFGFAAVFLASAIGGCASMPGATMQAAANSETESKVVEVYSVAARPHYGQAATDDADRLAHIAGAAELTRKEREVRALRSPTGIGLVPDALRKC